MRFLSLTASTALTASLLAHIATGCAGSQKSSPAAHDEATQPSHDAHAGHDHEGHDHASHAAKGEHAEAPGANHSAKGHHRFDDAAKWEKIFENPERDAWQKPSVVIDFMKIEPGMRVADIGSATGYFPVRIARRFPEAQVVGLDVEQTLVDHLNARAQKESLSNLSSRKVPFDNASLDENTDRVLVVDTYHHISDRVAYLKKLSESLSPAGMVTIIDFKQVELPFGGPPPAMRLTEKQVQQEFEEAGFVLDENDSESLAYQYMLRFKRR